VRGEYIALFDSRKTYLSKGWFQ